MIIVQLQILVEKMKGIVILMMSVKMVFFVDQITVQLHLVLMLKLIVVINQLLEMRIFVQLQILVEKMKGIAMVIMIAKMILSVDQTIVFLILGSILVLTVVW